MGNSEEETVRRKLESEKKLVEECEDLRPRTDDDLPRSVDHFPVGDRLGVGSILNSSQASFYSSVSGTWFGNRAV